MICCVLLISLLLTMKPIRYCYMMDGVTVDAPTPEPFLGQIFKTLIDAEECYRAYSKRVGFGMRIRSTRRRTQSNEICSRLYDCHRGNHIKSAKPVAGGDVDVDVPGSKKRRTVRRDVYESTGCKAKMFVVHQKVENHWVVTSIEVAHNHPLVTPSKIGNLRAHKNITPVAKELITLLNDSGIGPSRMMNVFTSLAGSVANVGMTTRDINNQVRSIRREAFDADDAQATLNYFKKLEVEDPNFFQHIKLDDDNRIEIIFWADSRCRIAYQNFGDAVTFDTTYRTNRYAMPFAPFTGVNHHYQSILFGFALLRDETEKSFIWLFETFLLAMKNKAPSTIVTDSDRQMAAAIATVMPTTHHALCTWHISNKYPERLNQLYAKHPTFKEDFNKCVRKSLTIGEFEERWKELVGNYGLVDHSWLNGMYAVKQKWIPAYTKGFFAAGMTTTGRSEGMNSFFDQFVNTSTSMKDFVYQSQRAIDKQYENEKKEDHDTTYKNRKLLLHSPLEIHGAQLFTKEIFRRFQVDLQKSLQYSIKKIAEATTAHEKWYTLSNASYGGKMRRTYSIVHFLDADFVKCACQTFEHSGMLCRHMLRFFTQKSYNEIPPQYIIHRWTINGNRMNGHVPCVSHTQVDYEQSESLRYTHLCNLLHGLAADGARTMEGYQYVLDLVVKEKPIVINFQVQNQHDDNLFDDEEEDEEEEGDGDGVELGNDGDGEGEANGQILEPIVSQTKGRKKSKRIKSSIEEATGKKKLRKCAICNKFTNHDKRNHYKMLGLDTLE